MAHTRIGDIVRGFSRSINSADRQIVVLKAYFDDSGTHKGSKSVVLAGFMASEDEWTAFEHAWQAILNREGLKSFHAADFESGYGACKDWPRVRREAVRADLRFVLAKTNLIGIGATVRADDWSASASPVVIERYHSPIYLAFEHCIQQTLHWAKRATDQQTKTVQRVSFFFDSFNREAARCLDIAKNYEEGWIHSDWFEGFSFGQVERTLPLQAADMLAHETYRLEKERIKLGKEPELSPHFKAMLEEGIPIHGQFYDGDALNRLSRQISDSQNEDLLQPPHDAGEQSGR